MGVIYEKKDAIAYVTIDNPEKANILDRETSNQIAEAWKEIWEDCHENILFLSNKKPNTRIYCILIWGTISPNLQNKVI